MKRPLRRLYVAGKRNTFKYTMATSLIEAEQLLGDACRVPDSDDIRVFWEVSGIAKMTPKERREKFGTSRQVEYNWRCKGGKDLPMWADLDKQARAARVKRIMGMFPGLSLGDLAKLAKVSMPTARQVAKESDYKLAQYKKMPPDERLIELATGKTWREFADAVGLKLATLRNHIYRRPALSEAIQRVRKRQPTGSHAKGKLDLQKVMAMGQKGMSAYAIAETLKVEQMTIRAHLQKWGKEFPNEFPPPYGNKRTTGDVVDGRHGRFRNQQG